MNSLLKEGLKQTLDSVKLKTKRTATQAKYLSEAFFGWAIMLGAVPYAAWHIPNEGILPLLGGLFVVALFFLGGMFVGKSLESLEEFNREKTAGELLEGIELSKGVPPRSRAH
jgi:hypothetical protein